MQSVEEIVAFLEQALQSGVRSRLVDRGEARAIIRRNGEVPDGAPPLGRDLDADLADFGFAVLDASLALRSLDRNHGTLRPAFQLAGRVFEALVKNGSTDVAERGFYRTIAGASYHLAGYAAMAYALFNSIEREELNLNPAEDLLVLLILRNFDVLRETSRAWLQDPSHSDEALSDQVRSDETSREYSLGLAVISGVYRGFSYFELALQTGDVGLVEKARSYLDGALGLASASGLVSLWWITRLARNLIDDLWAMSLHELIPLLPRSGSSEAYTNYRRIFIARLFQQKAAQVDLWPSQINAARRAADETDDLVVALPTSAGKTRIAELAVLTCLSSGKRVLIMTPLRALSAQTERSFQSAFAPLGVTISSLYGKSGLSNGDSHALASDAIVVTTPEKLDFALRSDPGIIDDIGLIVLDEGHMIGPNEREIRFEILVQRLLRRRDAGDRRIVCLSAILPEGDDLDDMTAWIRSDEPGEPVREDWRPTKQRYGSLEWRGSAGTLRYDLDDNGPFVPRFVTQQAAIPPQRTPRPTDMKELCLMAAWRFHEEKKRTLIFLTQANWVAGFASCALDLIQRGYLPPLLPERADIRDAFTVGAEWLGADHPAVACLKIGVAAHHGGLPSPFLREVERLLGTGSISVTAASPTLAQGLNLNASVLLAPYLVRSGEPISGEEFANVAGRAGRAFVDTEGLIVHVMMNRHDKRKRDWRKLVNEVQERSLRSGLALVIKQVILRMNKRGLKRSADGYEFLANSREDWLTEPDEETDGPLLTDLVAKLDSIILGLIEALDADSAELPELLDKALDGSLWQRQLSVEDPGFMRMQKIVLQTRARLVWNMTTSAQRKGHFAMGVGMDSGLRIDEVADRLGDALDQADLAALQGDLDALHAGVVSLAETLFEIPPFIPEKELPENWQGALKSWLSGVDIAAIGDAYTEFIEDALTYRLVWAMEAVRTRRVAHGWTAGDLAVEGMAAACVDTGLPDFRMSMLVRSGLPSRLAAKKVIVDLSPSLLRPSELRSWLESDEVSNASERPDWPTTSTHDLWLRFRNKLTANKDAAWAIKSFGPVAIERPADEAAIARVTFDDNSNLDVWTADYKKLGSIPKPVGFSDGDVFDATWMDNGHFILTSIGPNTGVS